MKQSQADQLCGKIASQGKKVESIFKAKHPNKISLHIIGIGGKGLYPIATILHNQGFKVTGSDTSFKQEISILKSVGVAVYNTHDEKNITPDIDMVIYSSIIPGSNPEIQMANKFGIPVVERSIVLGYLMKQQKSVAIAGSHGKSTTTGLLGLCMIEAGVDPTIVAGANIKELNSYGRLGDGPYIIVEACEYRESFYNLTADLAIITSIEKSHLEYYGTESKMLDAFRNYVGLFKEGSTLFINGDNQFYKSVTRSARGTIVTYGKLSHNDYRVANFRSNSSYSTFEVHNPAGESLGEFSLNIPGEYNALNLVSIIALFDYLQLPLESVKNTAKTFSGVSRRFETTRLDHKTVVIDDFAHHPTQVKNLIESIRQRFPAHAIHAIFQPRQYHLMRSFDQEYGQAFAGVSSVYITDILPALGDSEEVIKSYSIDKLIKSISSLSKVPVFHFDEYDQLIRLIKRNYTFEKSVFATIGAGDIYKAKDLIIEAFKQNDIIGALQTNIFLPLQKHNYHTFR